MSFVLWLEWQGFYANETLTEPEIVVRDKQVLDANRSAREKGIFAGMTIQEARNVVPEVVRRAWKEEDFVERQRAWLDLCLPFTYRVEPLDGHVAALDLSDHPQPTEIAERMLETLVSSVGLPLRYGAGPSKWIARLASRTHDVRSGFETAEFLSHRPVEDLLPIEATQRERLAFLGYRKIGDVARLPLGVLEGQFSEAGWRIAQTAKGSLADPVVSCYPIDCLAASLNFDGAPESMEIVELAFRKLARELAEGLACRNTIGKRVELTLLLEDGTNMALARTFARPIANECDVMNALRLMLPVPPESPIERLCAALPNLRKARRVQLDIEDRRSRSDAEESLGAAVTNVRTLFGEKAVQRGSEVVVPRWLRVRRAYRDAFGWAWV
jgi:nucleotidyltransferase/DNA polymerase involved in DNA repair